jgi:ABC-type polysaccharide/polyol phosphate export permease
LSATPFRRSLAIQVRVIGALLMREILTRYGRHNLGFLWLFLEPMLFTVAITALWSAAMSIHQSNLPIVAFAVTGYSSVLLWRNMPARCVIAITPNLALMYHRNVKVIDIFAARLLLEGAGSTIAFALLVGLFVSIGWMKLPEDVLKVMGAWALLAWFGVGLALLVGALSERSEVVEKLWHPSAYILFPLSGAVFMVDWLPADMQKLVLILPMVHGVELLREGWFGSTVRAHYDVGYFVVANLLLTLVALSQVRVIGARVTPE